MGALIAPSILAADFGRLAAEVAAVDEAGADWIHVDVMDGQFVPNLTIGPPVVKAVRAATAKPLDVHLMIAAPERYAADFAAAGADILTVHAEACPHLHRNLQQLRDLGVQAGVSLNPATPVAQVEHVLELADLVLVMSVNPGFGGQRFLAGMLPKIEQLRELRAAHGHGYRIEVDGGVSAATAPACRQAGAEVLVAGTAVFGAPDYAAAIGRLRADSASQEPT